MVIGVCKITIYIPGSNSLKDRRRVINGIKDKIRHNFNTSIAEIDDEGLWQRSKLGIACVSNEQNYVAETFSKIINIIKNNGEIYIIDSAIEFL